MNSLLDEFFLAEGLFGYERVKGLLRSGGSHAEASFNVFEVAIDRNSDIVLLRDVVGVFEPGAARFSVEEFERLIDDWFALHAPPRSGS